MGNLAMARAVSKMACTRAPLPTSAGTGVYERLPGEHSPKHPGKHRKVSVSLLNLNASLTSDSVLLG